jgi:hypothetical protein
MVGHSCGSGVRETRHTLTAARQRIRSIQKLAGFGAVFAAVVLPLGRVDRIGRRVVRVAMIVSGIRGPGLGGLPFDAVRETHGACRMRFFGEVFWIDDGSD